MTDGYTLNLFENDHGPDEVVLAEGAVVLRRFAIPCEQALLDDIARVTTAAPLRHMVTRTGLSMSAALSNCGRFGWVSDLGGYRYDTLDPVSNRPWPPMPNAFVDLATRAAAHAGFSAFVPDACLVNRYDVGARMALHQDREERGFESPIVSVSLGLPATFLFGGFERRDETREVELVHGDVVVWGGPSRLRFHGVRPIKQGRHPLVGEHRINLTFRRAG